MSSYTLNIKRMRANLSELSKIGKIEGKAGINRVSFSEQDMAGREFLRQYMENIGLESHMDGVGNVWGRWLPGQAQKEKLPSVIIGSHLDTVPQGGEFDGALGVLAGLEVVESLKEQGFQTKLPLEILATSEEEGCFGGMLGSQSLAGVVDKNWLETAQNQEGVSLKDAMKRHGLDYKDALSNTRPSETVKTFLELHIEQGPVLEQKKLSVGIVNAISGCAVWKICFEGRADHSGTTPMDMRADAFVGAAGFSCAIPDIIRAVGTQESRLTIGKIEILPNYPHTIPKQASCSLVLRDINETVMEKLADQCRSTLKKLADEHELSLSIEEISWLSPVSCSAEIVKLLQEEADKEKIDHIVMSSGAGHDCQFMANIAPAGLIFVPSKDGISHSQYEQTDWKDIEIGCRLLQSATIKLCS